MIRKIELLILLMAMLLIQQISYAENDAKANLAKEYLELSNTKESFDATIEVYVDEMAGQATEAEKNELRIALNKYMGWDALEEKTIEIVADLFSEKELSEINKFYKTDSGKALSKNSSKMATEMSNLILGNLANPTGDTPNE